MRERKSTMVELVDDLKTLPQTAGVLEMIREAIAGEYHDYKNQKYACGKVEVASKLYEEASLPSTPRLVRAAIAEIRRKVIDGEFDEEADEDDKAEMRKHLPSSAWATFGL